MVHQTWSSFWAILSSTPYPHPHTSYSLFANVSTYYLFRVISNDKETSTSEGKCINVDSFAFFLWLVYTLLIHWEWDPEVVFKVRKNLESLKEPVCRWVDAVPPAPHAKLFGNKSKVYKTIISKFKYDWKKNGRKCQYLNTLIILTKVDNISKLLFLFLRTFDLNTCKSLWWIKAILCFYCYASPRMG